MCHQVVDVPAQVQAEVQEYRLYHGVCEHCRKVHRAVRELALVGWLDTHHHLTQGKIRDLLARVLGVDFSVGAISQAQGQAPVAAASQTLTHASVLHMDETSFPRGGHNAAAGPGRCPAHPGTRAQDLWPDALDILQQAMHAFFAGSTVPTPRASD